MCNFEDMEYQETIVVMGLLLIIANCRPIESCRGPGTTYGRRKPGRELVPLVYRQHIPNISETTIGASGPAEGKISRDDKRFRDLVPNYNPNIVFKNEELTDADHWMSKRCRDRVNLLAIMVENEWSNVKLRVTEAWDEDGGDHSVRSLHLEGRAVDITTDDRDQTKYGMLARLAVEAGFDWVFYESKHHIHASVIADDSEALYGSGCFPADSTLTMENGESRKMSQLRVGDRILTSDRNTGETKASDVILLMHKNENIIANFLTITAISHTWRTNQSITLTPNHLLFIQDKDSNSPERWRPRAVFAEEVSIGDVIYLKTFGSLRNHTAELTLCTVTTITVVRRRGVYAPLTVDGTLIVDGIPASSYAVFENEYVSHALFLPLRILWRLGLRWVAPDECDTTCDGVHWYPKYIFNIASSLLPTGILNS